MEPDEGLEKLKETLDLCQYYIDCYNNHRNNLDRYFKDSPVIPWDFNSSLVFSRLDRFMHHLHLIEVMCIVLNFI